MKKNNIKQLKEIVSNEIFFDLSYQGVQAYNISANEYEVITGFWKCNGRYFFDATITNTLRADTTARNLSRARCWSRRSERIK